LKATNSVMRRFSRVRSSAQAIRSIRAGGTGSLRRPMNRMRTPSSCSSGVSAAIRRPIIAIRPWTSSCGRLQFSVENE
jgi:hypothetical protein